MMKVIERAVITAWCVVGGILTGCAMLADFAVNVFLPKKGK